VDEQQERLARKPVVKKPGSGGMLVIRATPNSLQPCYQSRCLQAVGMVLIKTRFGGYNTHLEER
jgi:hypothetical protein